MASSSRGKFPPKFNGMLWNTGGDLRSWGAQHWSQIQVATPKRCSLPAG
jgi:hypothetical protein